MVNSKNITDTDGRLFESMSSVFQKVYNQQKVDEKILNTVQENMLTTGKVTKCYPYLNKSEVRLDMTGKTVLCKNSLLFGGDVLLLYTPSGDRTFCEKLREPCVVPRGTLSCIVANIHNDDDEYYLLGYYLRDDLVYSNPATIGNFKVIATGAVSEYSIKFGVDGLKIVNNGEIETTNLDSYDEEIPKMEYYSKADVDKLIDDLREEFNDIVSSITDDTTESDSTIVDNGTGDVHSGD